MASAQKFIKKEMDLRTKLATNPDFISICIETAKKLGITADEWNANKASLLLFFANATISEDNKKDGIIRELLNN